MFHDLIFHYNSVYYVSSNNIFQISKNLWRELETVECFLVILNSKSNFQYFTGHKIIIHKNQPPPLPGDELDLSILSKVVRSFEKKTPKKIYIDTSSIICSYFSLKNYKNTSNF